MIRDILDKIGYTPMMIDNDEFLVTGSYIVILSDNKKCMSILMDILRSSLPDSTKEYDVSVSISDINIASELKNNGYKVLHGINRESLLQIRGNFIINRVTDSISSSGVNDMLRVVNKMFFDMMKDIKIPLSNITYGDKTGDVTIIKHCRSESCYNEIANSYDIIGSISNIGSGVINIPCLDDCHKCDYCDLKYRRLYLCQSKCEVSHV